MRGTTGKIHRRVYIVYFREISEFLDSRVYTERYYSLGGSRYYYLGNYEAQLTLNYFQCEKSEWLVCEQCSKIDRYNLESARANKM